MLFTNAILALTTLVRVAECLPSFTPPYYRPSTLKNDGTDAGRYDVRKTMAIVNPDSKWINSYYFLFWVTTVDGRKYHLCFNPILFGNTTTGGMYSLNDLNDPSEFKAIGASNRLPGYGNSEFLNFRSVPHNITSPKGSDNFSTIALDTDFAGIAVNTVVHPTGKNMYYGGVGGIVTPGFGDDFTTVPPGWSWYWANPHLTVTGTITLDGTPVKIDTKKSFGMLERQYGAFDVSTKGFYLFWAYLPNGIVVQVWVISPRKDGTGASSMATIWHPNGLHEVVPVDMSATRAWDPSVSKITGRQYFNKFKVALTARNAFFSFEKPIRDAEVRPAAGQSGIIISESYCEGTIVWEGESLPWFGHCEELSAR
ncbi:hypothetical protein G7Z17_g617 [Cylindrodendrum hubeiense]|uniref:Hydroxyneurosporene synthase n=1 Tax=Cylindrodendrum hubeiense TaxID=595255 RepID=A0A9P5LN22_9HYPO|nr:hypothetical protein G7Z17_g617 [Cylindrodendrum hubeiense]